MYIGKEKGEFTLPRRPSPVVPTPTRVGLEFHQMAKLSVFSRWPERASSRELEELADHMLGLHLPAAERPREDEGRPVLSRWQIRRRRRRELMLGSYVLEQFTISGLPAAPRRHGRRVMRAAASMAWGADC